MKTYGASKTLFQINLLTQRHGRSSSLHTMLKHRKSSSNWTRDNIKAMCKTYNYNNYFSLVHYAHISFRKYKDLVNLYVLVNYIACPVIIQFAQVSGSWQFWICKNGVKN